MDLELGKVLTEMTSVIGGLDKRIEEQSKEITTLKGKAIEKPVKSKPTEEESAQMKKDFVKRVVG